MPISGNKLFSAGTVFFILLLGFPCLAEFPPPPPTNAPPTELHKGPIVDGVQLPPYAPPAPKMTRYTAWEDGKIYDVTEGGFKVMANSYEYQVEMCADLEESDWIRIGTATNAAYDWNECIKDNPVAYFRVKNVLKPHPPVGPSFGSPPSPRKPSGYFRKKTE